MSTVTSSGVDFDETAAKAALMCAPVGVAACGLTDGDLFAKV